uniref:Na_H_Exchanger domain-containing protein n=1 Tax=Globodera pallida TaxID=36090 RepID=A0A183BLT1_GLOPA
MLSTTFCPLLVRPTLLGPGVVLLLLCMCPFSLSNANYSLTNSVNYTSSNTPLLPQHSRHGVKVASLKFDYVKAELVLALFILVIGLFKLSYHQFKYPQALVPESCCLIILGTLLGLIFWWTGTFAELKFLEFDQKVFFFFLLPPIILEAAYSLNDRAFIDNLGTICLYAVVGTVLNIAIVGGLLIWAEWAGMFGTFGIHVLDSFLFSSLIAAVDPVAVLAIFKEVGVNQMLYFMVFGESLLNDAVTVVCYNLVNDFKQLDDITLFDVPESELFHFSGIIGIIACGLIQIQYTMQNLSAKSQISINYIIKVISSVSESLIFIILGVMLVNEQNWFWDDWHPLFSLFSLLFLHFSPDFLVVLIYIILNMVFLLTYIVNCFTGGVRGSATVDIIDEQREKLWEDDRADRRNQTEREVEQMTRDTMQIQALFYAHNIMAYPDRNLVDEAKKELMELETANAYDKHMDRIARICEFREMKKLRGWRRVIGQQKPKRVSVNKGMLAMSGPTLCLSSTATHQQILIESLQQIDETEENDEKIKEEANEQQNI